MPFYPAVRAVIIGPDDGRTYFNGTGHAWDELEFNAAVIIRQIPGPVNPVRSIYADRWQKLYLLVKPEAVFIEAVMISCLIVGQIQTYAVALWRKARRSKPVIMHFIRVISLFSLSGRLLKLI